MKTKKMITGTILMLSLAFSSFANDSSIESLAIGNESIRSQLINRVGTPQLAKHQIKEGAVWVIFSINEEKEIVIENIRGNNEYLSDFVKSQLKDTLFDLSKIDVNQLYRIKINFKLI